MLTCMSPLDGGKSMSPSNKSARRRRDVRYVVPSRSTLTILFRLAQIGRAILNPKQLLMDWLTKVVFHSPSPSQNSPLATRGDTRSSHRREIQPMRRCSPFAYLCRSTVMIFLQLCRNSQQQRDVPGNLSLRMRNNTTKYFACL